MADLDIISEMTIFLPTLDMKSITCFFSYHELLRSTLMIISFSVLLKELQRVDYDFPDELIFMMIIIRISENHVGIVVSHDVMRNGYHEKC